MTRPQLIRTPHNSEQTFDHTYVRTIAVPVNGIGGTQFDLSPQQAETLYQNGRRAAEQFFSTWDFEAYKATYRGGQPPRSRRERLHEQMKRPRL